MSHARWRHPPLRALRLVLWGLVALGACEAPTPEEEATPGVAVRTASAPAADAPAGAPPSATLPAALGSACIAGDPAVGTPWSLVGAVASPLGMTAIEALAPRDSARFAARVARAVDVLPSDTSIADFRGIPVSVRAAWRVVPADGDTVVVALAVRRMPLESQPLEEVFTLVAAPGQRQGVREPLIEAWVARDVGREDEVPMRELVAVLAEGAVVSLVLVHDAVDGMRAEYLVRAADAWQAAWSGALPPCPTP